MCDKSGQRNLCKSNRDNVIIPKQILCIVNIGYLLKTAWSAMKLFMPTIFLLIRSLPRFPNNRKIRRNHKRVSAKANISAKVPLKKFRKLFDIKILIQTTLERTRALKNRWISRFQKYRWSALPSDIGGENDEALINDVAEQSYHCRAIFSCNIHKFYTN